jgi:hypothetical protein
MIVILSAAKNPRISLTSPLKTKGAGNHRPTLFFAPKALPTYPQ